MMQRLGDLSSFAAGTGDQPGFSSMALPPHVKTRVFRAATARATALLQTLEPRLMLSSVALADGSHSDQLEAFPTYDVDGSPVPNGTQGHANVVGFTPAKIRHAYGIDILGFTSPSGAITGDGSGQTIAIIDADNNPNFYSSSDTTNYPNSDLAKFCTQFGLPQFGAGGPTFTKIDETGGTNYPSNNTGWGSEIALDVEWSHAIAPEANIMLVECTNNLDDLFNSGVTYAANHGASVISMSFGVINSNKKPIDTTSYEGDFTHSGVTYVASTGDTGSPSGSPADSPNVLAVGGTSLSLNGDNTWSSETGWSDSGGGYSTAFSKPSYQNNLTISDPNNKRMAPDIAFDADPNTGVAIYDSYGYGNASAPWVQIGGTSLSAPCWAALVAIADQGRVNKGQSVLDTTAVHNALYQLPSTDFHDITSGSNGYSATSGYDLVTGIGSPIANLLIPDLAGLPQAAPSGLALTAGSDSGISHSDRITNIITPTITGMSAANSTVKLYENSTLIGQGGATSSGTFSITTTVLANGTQSIIATATTFGGTSPASGGLSITVDTVAPTIGTLSFNPNATSMTITVPFSENVSLINASLSVSGIASSSQAESFNTGTNTASFTFTPGYAHGVLPDGNYNATVVLANVSDIAGNHPTSTTPLNFFVLDGDANFDRVVNALDFNALASNYGKANPQYGDGDFNYDGTINSSDFAILAAKFGTQLAAADLPDDGGSADAQPASATVTQTSVFSDQPVSPNLADDVLT